MVPIFQGAPFSAWAMRATACLWYPYRAGQQLTIWPRATKYCKTVTLEGMRGRGYARAVWKNCFFTLFRNLIFSDPQRCARFPGSGNESSDLVFRNLIFSDPQRRARFPGSAHVSFRGPLKSQWALQAFEDTLLGMRGVCAAQGNGVPRKAFPPSGLEKHACAKQVCARVCALYIY